MKPIIDATDLRRTAAAQWPTIYAYYRDDNSTLGLLADFINHSNSPATELKRALISAALEG